MSSFSSTFFKSCEPTSIIHLGAGRCRDLESYIGGGARRIILVEGNPVTANHLKKHTENLNNVEVIEAAIGDKTGSGSFYIYNFQDANSLRIPTGMLELFPGLQLEKELKTDVVTADRLIGSLCLEDNRNILVIDCPGEEFAVLDALKKSDQLKLFQRIVFQGGITPLYENSASFTAIVEFLKQENFEVFACAYDDPDRPHCLMGKSERLEQALAELALREADLGDLQERYRQSKHLQEEQYQLLMKIYERLSVASEYFHQLEIADMATPNGEHRAHSEKADTENVSSLANHLSSDAEDEV